MTPERYQKLRTILAHRQPDLTLLADEVHKPHNLAAIIRTCDAVGIPKVHLCDPDIRARQLRGRSMGSNRWVDIEQYDSVTAAGKKLKESGFKIIAAHFSDKAKPYNELDYTSPCALLMGSEKRGVSPEGAALADEHVIIPMEGMVQSFNVSVAAGIILMEAHRQRKAAGLYDENRITSEQQRKTLFQWGYPELARFCDDRELAYPEIGEVGQLIQPEVWYAQTRK